MTHHRKHFAIWYIGCQGYTRNAHHPLRRQHWRPLAWAHSEIATITFQTTSHVHSIVENCCCCCPRCDLPSGLDWFAVINLPAASTYACLFFNDALSDCITLMTTIDGSDGSSQYAIPFHGQWWWLNDDPRARSGCHGRHHVLCLCLSHREKSHLANIFTWYDMCDYYVTLYVITRLQK